MRPALNTFVSTVASTAINAVAELKLAPQRFSVLAGQGASTAINAVAELKPSPR